MNCIKEKKEEKEKSFRLKSGQGDAILWIEVEILAVCD